MEEWSTYAIANFIPFTAEVYLRLMERVNDAWWPLHVATVALGTVAVALSPTDRRRFVGPLLALLWAWPAHGFFQQYYANLNWAGGWLAGAFYLQAVMVAFSTLVLPLNARIPLYRARSGWLLAIAGLLWPLASLAGRNGFPQAEVIGIQPDPTAVFTLGIMLAAFPGRILALALPIPLLWCLVSGLTLQVLELPQAPLLYVVSGVTLAVALPGCLYGKRI